MTVETTIVQALKECEEKEPDINDDVEALQAQLAAQEHLFQVSHFMTYKCVRGKCCAPGKRIIGAR